MKICFRQERGAALTALALCALGGTFLAGAAGAASLWDDRTNWIVDVRPGRVGDVVTVLVNERTNAKDEATMDLKKSSSNSVSDGTGILKFIRALSLTSKNSSAGDG